MHEIKEILEQVILVGVSSGPESDTENSLDELEELVDTAGAVTLCKVIQRLDAANNATYIGKGKIEEVKNLIAATDATGIVCDDELTPVQIRNLEDMLDTKVMDRTLIILDIFAKRATTKEGKIQVELAQLRYRQTRLSGLGSSMSRLGGGIGTRGPGEKKLEIDRRVIKSRIAQLRGEVREMESHRMLARTKRAKNHIPVVSIVGYTNAGKSTLLNQLTGAGVLEKDQLFATLDPTTRNIKLESGQEILLTDTVGFIRKLPHHLVDAFRSTLEEAKYADILIHMVDASNPQVHMQMETVYQTLDDLGVKDKPVITVFNKIDRLEEPCELKDLKADACIYGSVKKGIGIEDLFEALERILRESKVYLEKVIPYADAGKINLIRKYGELLEEDYQEDGIHVKAYIPNTMQDTI